ncbi:MAG: hypothetical protein A3F70_02705 [Acidobacteria bacterium RIFCSPLOWO2_12_FULL_67_14]|nr:MAG: hypothetical protein A3H29_19370 [Acidobacteria bacterium RIFCSPLOWO2_02_FULL_67_21]OFW37084.1 MAG: hypothetical protein A3F70_02705 [Acidobacteria bacterium RIFCSPLOWO2_12_FULL_67_14]
MDADRPAEETPQTRRRVLRWLERMLVVVGVVLLGYCGYVSLESWLYQRVANRELEVAMVGPPAAVPSPSRALPRIPQQGELIGRIEIPRLGLSAVIRAGTDDRTLRLAVGHISGTALPEDGGNIGLAAHRDTFFRPLRDIRIADEIRLVTPTGTFTFLVADTSIVKPTDTWVLDPTRGMTLTLVTCYPFSYVGAAPDRFIVRAVPTHG